MLVVKKALQFLSPFLFNSIKSKFITIKLQLLVIYFRLSPLSYLLPSPRAFFNFLKSIFGTIYIWLGKHSIRIERIPNC